MSRKFVISDSHFFHANIIKYCDRPFANVHAMNEEMVKRWNNTVRKDDIVFHLGDIAMGKNKDEVSEMLRRLNGRIFLVLGNHDGNRNFYLDQCGFERVYDYPIIYRGFVMLSHEPMFLEANSPYINIHGHLHQNKMAGENYINVSAEHLNYTPALLDDILKPYNIDQKELDALIDL